MPVCDPILPDARVREMHDAGLWRGRLITDDLDAHAAARPDVEAVVDASSVTGTSTRLTYGELATRVERIALGLTALGVAPGDVVSAQLPNGWQFTALHLACVRIGAVTNPLMPIFRERELKFMLGLAQSKVMVVPRRYRKVDYPAMVKGLRGDLPDLEHVLVMGGDGDDSFESTLVEHPWENELDAAVVFAERKPRADDVVLLLYTSGTTGEPKGVMHTSNALLSTVNSYIERLRLTSADAVFMASPVAHQIGYSHGVLMPIVLGTKSVLQDLWDPHEAAQRIGAEGCAFTKGATPFLSDLTDAVAAKGHDVSSLRFFVCGGATIPRLLVQRARDVLGVHIIAVFGTTETNAATLHSPDDPEEKIATTDGFALGGMEVSVVDGAGAPVPQGNDGHLRVRGSGNFVGYLKRPDLYTVDAEGWFDTGDLARLDTDGYVRITGRAKDVIVRGGENVPVAEVEQVLYQHPAVREVAIVAMPDPRLGERACSFVTLRPGASLTFDDMVEFLEGQRMARHYFPERLEVLDDMPRTPTGKIQKYQLREIAASWGDAAGGVSG